MRTSVLLFSELASPVNEIWFAKVKKKSMTSAGFEPTTSGVEHQRSNQLSYEVSFKMKLLTAVLHLVETLLTTWKSLNINTSYTYSDILSV